MSETTAPTGSSSSTPQVADCPNLTIELPVCPPEGKEYIPRKLEARLNDRQARALFALRNALDRQTATTDNGQRVVYNPDAIRWLLEQIADQLDKAES